MSEITIRVEDYLSNEEIKEICKDYVRSTLYGHSDAHKERVLLNMAYNSAHSIIDDILTDVDKVRLRKDVLKLLKNPSSTMIFRKKDAWGSEDSAAYLEVKRTVAENLDLIRSRVIEAIQLRDYSNDIPRAGDAIMSFIADAITQSKATK